MADIADVTAAPKTPEPSEPDSTHFGMTRSKLQSTHRHDIAKITKLTNDYTMLKQLDLEICKAQEALESKKIQELE